MNDGYIQTKIRDLDEKIKTQENTIKTLTQKIEHMDRRFNSIQELVNKLSNIDREIGKIEKQIIEMAAKANSESQEYFMKNILSIVNKELKQHKNNVNKFVLNQARDLITCVNGVGDNYYKAYEDINKSITILLNLLHDKNIIDKEEYKLKMGFMENLEIDSELHFSDVFKIGAHEALISQDDIKPGAFINDNNKKRRNK